MIRPVLLVLVKAWRSTRSRCLRLFFQAAYTGVRFAPDVYFAAQSRLRCTDGGQLQIGEDSELGRGCLLVAKRGRLAIGARVFVGAGTHIVAQENVTIGDDCLIAEGVTIRDQNHGTQLGELPFSRQRVVTAPITIGDNVWLGAKASITPGVAIGNNVVVGANAVVTRDLPADCVAVGCPARVIRPL